MKSILKKPRGSMSSSVDGDLLTDRAKMRSALMKPRRSMSSSVDGDLPLKRPPQTDMVQTQSDTDVISADLFSCCRAGNDRLNKKAALYPVLTEQLLAQYSGTEFKETRRISSEKDVDPNSYITLHKIIAVGKFSVYYFGTESCSGEPRTVKIYRPTLGFVGRKRAGLEKQILSLSDKPAALPVLHFAFKYQFYKCLVFEPMYNESLEAKLLYARRLFPDVAKSFFVDMVCAVAFLHHNKIIHRNLTLDSFWIQANRHLKLTSYNYCVSKRGLAKWEGVLMRRPTNFTAPELFFYQPFSRQTDIWALGVIFFRMLGGRFPFYGSDSQELKQNIIFNKEKYSEFFSFTSATFCAQMLEKLPDRRLGHHERTDTTFQNHVFFADVDWDSAHSQTRRGPPIRWKFPVAEAPPNGQPKPPEKPAKMLTFEDLESFDTSKSKFKPLRMEAIRDGNHAMLSPEHLEQRFLRPPDQRGREAGNSSFKRVRESFARRFSLSWNLRRAFLDLEQTIESEDGNVKEALEDYYQSLSEKINKFSRKSVAKKNSEPTIEIVEDASDIPVRSSKSSTL